MTKISVLKYGGTSINSEEKLSVAQQTILSELKQQFKPIIVVSAFRGVTDLLHTEILNPAMNEKLLGKWQELHGNCSRYLSKDFQHDFEERIKAKVQFLRISPDSIWAVDDLLAEGETYAVNIFSNYMKSQKIETHIKNFVDPLYPVVGYGEFGNARIDLEKTRENCRRSIIEELKKTDCVIAPGVGGVSSKDGRVRVRRGASDYVATSLSYGVKADRLWILSDVQGLQAADSRIIKDPPILPHLTVGELLDACALGAKNTNTAFFLPLTRHCPKETYFAKYDDLEGEKTQITESPLKEDRAVKLVGGREVLLYTFEGYDIERPVLVLEQKLAETYDFIRGGGFKKERFFAFFDLNLESRISREISDYEDGVTVSASRKAIVGIVGEGMKNTKKIVERMGKALGDINIIYVLDISKISAGVVIEKGDMQEAVERLYADFIEDESR